MKGICGFIFFILSFIYSGSFYSQDQEIDSLLRRVEMQMPDSEKVNTYLRLSTVFYTYDLDTTYYFSSKALKLAEQVDYLEGIGTASNWVGYVLELQGDANKALKLYNRSLKIFKDLNNQEGISESYTNLGLASYSLGRLEEALSYHLKSLKIRENEGDKRGIAESLNNLAMINFDNGDIEDAIENYEKCLEIQIEIGDDYGRAYSLNNLSAIYFAQNEVQRGLDSCLSGAKIRQEVGDMWGLAYSYNNIGMMYEQLGEREKGLAYYEKCLEINKTLGDNAGIAMITFQIGDSYLQMGDVKKAKVYGELSLEKSKELGYPSYLKDASLLMKKVSYKEGNYLRAYNMLELYSEMKDSLINEENQKNYIEQKEKYKYEKLAAADSVKVAEEKKVTDAKIVAQKAQISEERTQRYTLYGGIAFLFLFGGFMYNRFRVTRKQKVIIEKQKDEVEIQKEFAEKQKKEADEQREIVEEKNKEILDSINYAKRIQAAILPPDKVVKEYLQESFILYKPKDIVAGDFYWMEHSGSTILFAAADCTGHGVPGAMVSVICNNGLNRSVREHGLVDPGEILNRTREIVIKEFEKSEEDVKDGMDIAICSLDGMKLKYAGAHNPLWIIREGEVIETKADKQPIGKFENAKPYNTHTFDLLKGDTIYIFSDGYVDQFGGTRGKKYKSKAFKELLISIQNEPMEQQKKLIDLSFENWKGELEQIDDVCVIGVRV